MCMTFSFCSHLNSRADKICIMILKASKQAGKQAGKINVLIYFISPSYVQNDRQKNKNRRGIVTKQKRKKERGLFLHQSRTPERAHDGYFVEKPRNTCAVPENRNATAKASKETKKI